MLYLLMGTAPPSFQSKAAWVIVRAESKDAWKQPPVFSDALNHSFPEESWRTPRLPQIQLCLFRCWLHARERSSGRRSSHRILGSATKNKKNNKPPHQTKNTLQKKPLYNFYRYPTFSLKVYMLCLSLYASIFPLPSTPFRRKPF